MPDAISVLIPVYNGARYLHACIESVVNQTLPADEIVVVDDGSEDDTSAVAAAWGRAGSLPPRPAWRAPLRPQPRSGDGAGDIIGFIDSDDLWLPGKLELQMAALSRENEPTMVFGYMQQFVSGDLTPEEAAEIRFNPGPLPGLSASALLMRKSDCQRTGPFDESVQTGEFIEWCSRARDKGIKPVMVPEIVCRRRLHRNNFGRGGAAVHSQYLRMLKKVLDRRREQG